MWVLLSHSGFFWAKKTSLQILILVYSKKTLISVFENYGNIMQFLLSQNWGFFFNISLLYYSSLPRLNVLYRPMFYATNHYLKLNCHIVSQSAFHQTLIYASIQFSYSTMYFKHIIIMFVHFDTPDYCIIMCKCIEREYIALHIS